MEFYHPFEEKGTVSIQEMDLAIRKLPKPKQGSKNKKSQLRNITKCGSIRLNIKYWQVFKRDGFKCYLCGTKAVKIINFKGDPNQKNGNIRFITDNGSFLTVDHWLPKTLGGNNRKTNLKACCDVCNRERGHYLTLEDITEMHEFGIDRIINPDIKVVYFPIKIKEK